MNTRLELLSRKNKGRALLQEHLPILSNLLGTDIKEDDFLDLEQSDKIREEYYSKFKSYTQGDPGFFQITFPSRDFDQDHVFEAYLLEFLGYDYYWITNYSEYYGVLPVKLQDVKGKFLEIIEFDKDSLNLISKGLDKGILLDYYEEQREFFYELSTW